MISLTKEEKREYCDKLAAILPELRKLISLTQEEFGDRCGVSRERINLIENGRFDMTWSQFTSFMLLVTVNRDTKEFLIANKIFDNKLYCYFQLKEEGEAHDLYIPISRALIKSYLRQTDEKL